MAVDYFAQVPCKVREEVSDGQLLEMIKSRNRAQLLLETMRKNPGPHAGKPESEWTFMLKVRHADRVEEKQLFLRDMLAQSEPLNALSVHCIKCPANVRKDSFGCGGAINYPIAPETEGWLLSRLPDDIASPRGKLLLKIIVDMKFDGVPIDAARQRSELYVRKKPTDRRWGGFLSRKTIVSSQVLQMLLGMGSMPPVYARTMAFIFGFASESMEPITSSANAPAASDPGGVVMFKYFLSAAAVAGKANVALLVDA